MIKTMGIVCEGSDHTCRWCRFVDGSGTRHKTATKPHANSAYCVSNAYRNYLKWWISGWCWVALTPVTCFWLQPPSPTFIPRHFPVIPKFRAAPARYSIPVPWRIFQHPGMPGHICRCGYIWSKAILSFTIQVFKDLFSPLLIDIIMLQLGCRIEHYRTHVYILWLKRFTTNI